MYPEIHGLVEGEFSDEKGFAALKELLKENDRVWFIGSGNARDEIIEKWENMDIDAEETASVMISPLQQYSLLLYTQFSTEHFKSAIFIPPSNYDSI